MAEQSFKVKSVGGRETRLPEDPVAFLPVYRAHTAEAAAHELDAFDVGPWGAKYPSVAQRWRRNWEAVIPFAFPAEVRKIIYTSTQISVHRM